MPHVAIETLEGRLYKIRQARGAGTDRSCTTGKLPRLFHRELSGTGFAVAIVNPYRSRKLSDAFGQLAKTDAIDARMLALYSEAMSPGGDAGSC